MKRMNSIIGWMVLMTLVSLDAQAQILAGEPDRDSYSLGFQIGTDLHRQGTQIDAEALLRGVQDALSASEPRVSPEEMQNTLMEMKETIVADKRMQKQASLEKYRGEDREFLASNVKNEGITTRPSGLQYRVIKGGTGRTPGPNDRVKVHYKSMLVDGREFYNTRRGAGKPQVFHVGAVVKGMSEALQLMQEGAQWRLFVPADLAYGERGPAGERAVVMDVELISIGP